VSTAAPSPSPAITTRPLLGVFGVLLGALIATCTGRLLSVGLADLRGALHLGYDEASWISTAFNAPQMFIGPFSVYLGGLLGPRRVLLACASAFTLLSLLLPFAPNLPALLTLLVFAGLTAGVFYPLTLSFVLRNLPMRYILVGIAMYAADVEFTTNVATSLEAWYLDHLSWHWIFWNGALLTPVMMVLIYFGIPYQPLPEPKEGQPKPSWRGFLYASLGFALLYIALDQGQRLDWFHSGIITGCTVAGLFLLAIAAVRHWRMPNPLVNLQFLLHRNTLLLSLVLISFRFVMLGVVVIIPSYLGSVKGYIPLQTGFVLLWVGLPQALCGVLAIALLRFIDARLVMTFGFALVAISCLMNAGLTSAWSGSSFAPSQMVMALGLAFAFNGMVGGIILEVVNSGALKRPIDVLTFAGFFQTARLFGGEAGAALMQHFLAVREQYHSNILGLGVQLGDPATYQRILGLRAGMLHHSVGVPNATGRAVEILSLQLRQQAFTLAITDAFLLVATAVVCCLLVISCMAPVPTQFRQVIRSA
jgi:MFS transporter, DHA2 family, multidrug resistance protein